MSGQEHVIGRVDAHMRAGPVDGALLFGQHVRAGRGIGAQVMRQHHPAAPALDQGQNNAAHDQGAKKNNEQFHMFNIGRETLKFKKGQTTC